MQTTTITEASTVTGDHRKVVAHIAQGVPSTALCGARVTKLVEPGAGRCAVCLDLARPGFTGR